MRTIKMTTGAAMTLDGNIVTEIKEL